MANRVHEVLALLEIRDVEECPSYRGRWGRPPLVRLHVVRVHVESVGDEILQLPCAPKSVLSVGEGEVANAEAIGSPSRAPACVHHACALG